MLLSNYVIDQLNILRNPRWQFLSAFCRFSFYFNQYLFLKKTWSGLTSRRLSKNKPRALFKVRLNRYKLNFFPSRFSVKISVVIFLTSSFDVDKDVSTENSLNTKEMKTSVDFYLRLIFGRALSLPSLSRSPQLQGRQRRESLGSRLGFKLECRWRSIHFTVSFSVNSGLQLAPHLK